MDIATSIELYPIKKGRRKIIGTGRDRGYMLRLASAERVIVSTKLGMLPYLECHSNGRGERHFEVNLIVMEMRG